MAGTEPSFVELDVLEFGAHHAADDDLHLLRIPKTNAPKKSGNAPSFAGFLYASAGLAMLLVACEQGERLDWWRSEYSTHCCRRGVLPDVRAGSEATRSDLWWRCLIC